MTLAILQPTRMAKTDTRTFIPSRLGRPAVPMNVVNAGWRCVERHQHRVPIIPQVFETGKRCHDFVLCQIGSGVRDAMLTKVGEQVLEGESLGLGHIGREWELHRAMVRTSIVLIENLECLHDQSVLLPLAQPSQLRMAGQDVGENHDIDAEVSTDKFPLRLDPQVFGAQVFRNGFDQKKVHHDAIEPADLS